MLPLLFIRMIICDLELLLFCKNEANKKYIFRCLFSDIFYLRVMTVTKRSGGS